MKFDDQEMYDYFFEDVGRGVIRGANDPRGEHFTGMALSNSIVRELIQNSLDAKSKSSDTVTVEFEIRTIPSWDIPGIDTLRRVSSLAVKESFGYQGIDSLESAVKSLAANQMTILRVSDYGTTGLLGSELNDSKSPLTSLVRGEGLSSNDSGRGGSFGIGSSVGFVASAARTVAYTTLREADSDGVLFASSCRLASFVDEEGKRRDGTGIFTNISRDDTLEFPRGVGALSQFEERTVPGTDVYIYDYKNALNDLSLAEIRECVLENFLVAIYEGRLIVSGEGPKGKWTLNQESISRYALAHPIYRTYYLAISKGDIIRGQLKRVGDVRLHITIDPDQDKQLPVVMMRVPKMRIGTYRPSIQLNYGAIFICDDPKGNELLRNIEPPTHDRWNTQGPRSNAAAVKEIRDFIKQEISALFADKIGQTATIKGLENNLPLQSPVSNSETNLTQRILGTLPKGTDPVDTETPVILGVENNIGSRNSEPKPFQVTVQKQGVSTPEGSAKGTRGEHTGTGQGTEQPSTDKKIPTDVDPGSGKSKVNPNQLSLKSYQQSGTNETVLLIRGQDDLTGVLPLVGIGSDGSEFELEILSAHSEREGTRTPIEFDGNRLKAVHLSSHLVSKLVIEFGNLGRYRIGVASGD